MQVLLARAGKDFPASQPPPLRFIRSCSSSLAAATLHKLEAAFKVPVLEVGALRFLLMSMQHGMYKADFDLCSMRHELPVLPPSLVAMLNGNASVGCFV